MTTSDQRDTAARDTSELPTDQAGVDRKHSLPPAAQRALAEADARRRARDAAAAGYAQPAELGGREGPDPARYGDWENKGIASDF